MRINVSVKTMTFLQQHPKMSPKLVLLTSFILYIINVLFNSYFFVTDISKKMCTSVPYALSLLFQMEPSVEMNQYQLIQPFKTVTMLIQDLRAFFRWK
jgi:hypothetical protein